METYEDKIGENIREARQRKRISQEELAKRSGIANTTLSAYENSRKIPNLTTIAKIARGLGMSIEQLYYGNDAQSVANANAEPVDEGRRIVNSVFYLWKKGIVSYYESYSAGVMVHYDQKDVVGTMLVLNRYRDPIRRLIGSLDEFKIRRNTYPEPERYLEMILASVAAEINEEIAKGK